MIWKMSDCLAIRQRIAASDSEGATDDEVVAMIERITGRPFVFGGATGLEVMS